MIRILLVDDKASIREEMRRLLELEEDIQVIGEAANGWEAIERTSTLQPDLILMDKAMPSLDGIEATRLIKKDHPGARIIFLAAEDIWRQEALQAGAEAYLLKDHGFHAVVGIIKKAMEPHPRERIERGFRLRGWLIEGFRRLWAQSPALTMGLLILLLVALSDVALLILPLSALELMARALIHYSLAAISLLFGVFFFAYALRCYANIALILLFNGENGLVNGNGHVEGQGFRNGLRNGLSKIFGNGVDNAFANGYHLKPQAQPFVSIHLPLYNEKEVVERLLTACTSLDYANYEVIVADDSTDETTKILERWAEHPRVKISHRQDRGGFKGGALQVALQRTDPEAEFIIVFDADFIPPPDIITQFLAYFYSENSDSQHLADDRVAVVQGYQWHMLNANENWITRGIRVEFSGSYVIERPGQQLLGSMKMIAGSVFMIRADVLRKHGWGISITEDWELTLRLYLDGYKVLYTPFIQAPAECISRFQEVVQQRMRWARGHTFNVKKYFWRVLTSPHISRREKAEFLYYAPYYLQSVFFIIGTICWLISELILHQRIPYWTALLGWSLVFTNTFALVMANLCGLFLERGVRHNWSGIFSFLVLSNLLVPFQAYAALRGLLEKDEGGWHRTLKSGHITEILRGLRLGRKLRRLLPKDRRRWKAPAHADAVSDPGEAIPPDIYNIPIQELHLSTRVFNLLRGAGITVVGQILQRLDKAKQDILAIHYFGPTALLEVKRALYRRGLLSASPVPLEARLPSLAPPKLVPLPGRTERFIARAYVRLLRLVYLVSGKLEDKGLLTTEKRASHRRRGARGSLRPLRPRPTAQRRLMSPASAIIIVIVAAMLGLTVLPIGIPAVLAAPDVYYLWDEPKDEDGLDLATLYYPGYSMRTACYPDTSGYSWDVQNDTLDYFYSRRYPTGAGDGGIAAGNYTFNVYVTTPPDAGKTITWAVEVGYCDSGCDEASDYHTIVSRSGITYDENTTTGLHAESIGSGSAVTFTADNEARIYFKIVGESSTEGGQFSFGYNGCTPPDTSNLSTPSVTVPKNIVALVIMAPIIPLLIAMFSGKRRATLLSIILTTSLIFNLAFLSAKVPVAYAAPDVYYLHDTDTSGISPAGEYMNTTIGNLATILFDSAGDTAYWYSDVTYPTGDDDGGIAAGAYSFHMHFSDDIGGMGANMVFWFEVGYSNPDGSGYTQITRSDNITFTSSTSSPRNISLGNGSAITFTAASPKRIRFQIYCVSAEGGMGGPSLTLQYDQGASGADSYLSTPSVTVPEKAMALIILVPFIPIAVSMLQRRRKARHTAGGSS